jgi:HSP20 family molecular chaperone IbpA
MLRIVIGHPVEPLPGLDATEGLGTPRALMPPVDIHETPEGLILEADLPGVAESDLVVQLVDNVLSLQARVAARGAAEGATAQLLHEEWPQGVAARSFILSDEVDRDRISAELRDGVLRIVLPRAERTRARRIEVRST